MTTDNLNDTPNADHRHHMQKIGHGTWCTCGQYLGGLGYDDGRAPSAARTKYAIHRAQVHNAQR